jgi:hypothetical protein
VYYISILWQIPNNWITVQWNLWPIKLPRFSCQTDPVSKPICFFFIFKVCILLREYNQYIPITPSMQQLFINIWGTTCFDPNGPSSGAARLTHSTTEMQCVHTHLHTYGSKKVTFYVYSIPWPRHWFKQELYMWLNSKNYN